VLKNIQTITHWTDYNGIRFPRKEKIRPPLKLLQRYTNFPDAAKTHQAKTSKTGLTFPKFFSMLEKRTGL